MGSYFPDNIFNAYLIFKGAPQISVVNQLTDTSAHNALLFMNMGTSLFSPTVFIYSRVINAGIYGEYLAHLGDLNVNHIDERGNFSIPYLTPPPKTKRL